MPERKVPYKPSTEARFVVSSDPFSQERYGAVQETVRILIRRYGPIKDGILLGSLSKGKVLNVGTARQSDIDLILAVDTDQILREYRTAASLEPELKSSETKVFNEYPNCDEDTLKILSYGRFVSIKGTEFLSAKTDATISLGDVPFTMTGTFSIFEQTQKVFRGGPNWFFKKSKLKGANPRTVSCVALNWGWDLTGGLRPYREAFFEQLGGLNPQARDANWRLVDMFVRDWERDGNIPPQLERFYPRTVEEAKAFYLDPQVFANSVKT